MKLSNLEPDYNCGRWNDTLRSFFSLIAGEIYVGINIVGKTIVDKCENCFSLPPGSPDRRPQPRIVLIIMRCSRSVNQAIKSGAEKIAAEKGLIHDSHNVRRRRASCNENRNMLHDSCIYGWVEEGEIHLTVKKSGGSRGENIMIYGRGKKRKKKSSSRSSRFHSRESIEIRKLC